MGIKGFCGDCPRYCAVNRRDGESGFCHESAGLRVSYAGLHFGEEPSVTGKGGSGTVFVTGCNLRCPFCQNRQISRGGMGILLTSSEFAILCCMLESRGAENINIVTGSHQVNAIAAGLEKAKLKGLGIPVVWNSSGYDSAESLQRLCGLVDMYLPDVKTLDVEVSRALFKAPDYPSIVKSAVRQMILQTGNVRQPAAPGLIIRHMVMPGFLDGTRDVLAWYAEECAPDVVISIMFQYTPVRQSLLPDSVLSKPDLSRSVSRSETAAVYNMLDEFGIDDGFIQEPCNSDDWLPDFRLPDPFRSPLSVPVWHWSQGVDLLRTD